MDEEYKESIKKSYQALTKNSKDREALEALRGNFQYCNRSVHSLSFDIPEAFLNLLITVLEDVQVPTKTRFLVAFILKSIIPVEPEIIKTKFLSGNNKSFRQKNWESKITYVLLPLFYSCGSESSFELNVTNFIQWVLQQTGEFRTSVMTILLLLAKKHISILKISNHIQHLENKFEEFLSKASLFSEQKQANSKSFWNLNITAPTPEPVTELDSTIAKEFFTILNIAQAYTEDQSFNILTFSILYSWLSSIYYNTSSKSKTIKGGKEEVEKVDKISSHFLETIISYCFRLIEQAKLKPLVADPLTDIAVVESIRIFDLLSSIDPSLVVRLSSTIKKTFNINVASSKNGSIYLALLQYVLNHSEVIVLDSEPMFRTFFTEFLSKNYTNPVIAHSFLEFCVKNKSKLIQNTNVFFTYFPAILKILAWFPRSFLEDMLTILPCMIGHGTIIEVLHSLLDLPLIVSAMEKSEQFREMETEQQSPYRVLYNHLLRNESGAPLNFWELETTLPLIQDFCKETVLTPRISEIVKIIPKLLSLYFDVIISCASEDQMKELLPIVFQRIGQLFPLESFQKNVQKMIEVKTLAIFHKWPSFVISQKDLIITLIGDSSNVARQELILCACWIVGEYTSTAVNVDITPEILNDYYETLEVFAYERMSLVKLGLEPGLNSSKTSSDQDYTTRLMLILISALSKLASRWHPLSSRVILCLAKILRQQQYFNSIVVTRANECIALLKFPSIAAAILDATHKTGPRLSHVDDQSSLPFILESTISSKSSQKVERLHQFLPV